MNTIMQFKNLILNFCFIDKIIGTLEQIFKNQLQKMRFNHKKLNKIKLKKKCFKKKFNKLRKRFQILK